MASIYGKYFSRIMAFSRSKHVAISDMYLVTLTVDLHKYYDRLFSCTYEISFLLTKSAETWLTASGAFNRNNIFCSLRCAIPVVCLNYKVR